LKTEVFSVIGLGYVGLPVAVAFAKKFEVIGFDINKTRIRELIEGHDRTHEVEADDLKNIRLTVTADPQDLARASFHIVTVPTPIDQAHRPDLTPVYRATETLAKYLKAGDIVVYESTVYPGVTEEECVPILEKISGMKCGVDFKVGYSPERINPGDKTHRFENIKKVVSGMDEESTERVARAYGSVVTAGVFSASSIKVAEAAKVIENTQRDLNVALINELSLIFDRLGIDTYDVLAAAGTKWNFLNFKPGLVGGHCIGVDPYYLTHKAESVGYIPQVILSGRRVNDNMGAFIAQKVVKCLAAAKVSLVGGTVTVLGATFKENCPDIRNSRVFDLIKELQSFNIKIQLADPMAESHEVEEEYGIGLTKYDDLQPADAVVVAVSHSQYVALDALELKRLCRNSAHIFDVKAIYDRATMLKSDVHLHRL
jgi:UDP-N-acetyl-D-galactosamine dehydrogenase